MTVHYIAVFTAVLINVLAQLLMKSAINKHSKGIKIQSLIFKPIIIASNFLFLVVTLLTLYALQEIPLKNMAFILPMNYLLISLISFLVLKEEWSKNKIIGMILIIIGIIMYNLN